ncbi:hypothetical protein [Bradyrhizobium sp. 192]|uniref:hypothetical protein n=1 Tax=Bradyrhizobium sp. 192 TaxID=2782660 RepID=UPI001FFF2D0C|nr:hypothetical protein [Bradyrhizobium sp. 192]
MSLEERYSADMIVMNVRGDRLHSLALIVLRAGMNIPCEREPIANQHRVTPFINHNAEIRAGVWSGPQQMFGNRLHSAVADSLPYLETTPPSKVKDLSLPIG